MFANGDDGERLKSPPGVKHLKVLVSTLTHKPSSFSNHALAGHEKFKAHIISYSLYELKLTQYALATSARRVSLDLVPIVLSMVCLWLPVGGVGSFGSVEEGLAGCVGSLIVR